MEIIDQIQSVLTEITAQNKVLDVNYVTNLNQSTSRTDPYITYLDITENPAFHANDTEKMRVFYFDVDIYTKKPYLIPGLKKEIEKRMKSIGFETLPHASTSFDSESGICHKPLSFRISQNIEEE